MASNPGFVNFRRGKMQLEKRTTDLHLVHISEYLVAVIVFIESHKAKIAGFGLGLIIEQHGCRMAGF
jgi:hypothetical protein